MPLYDQNESQALPQPVPATTLPRRSTPAIPHPRQPVPALFIPPKPPSPIWKTFAPSRVIHVAIPALQVPARTSSLANGRPSSQVRPSPGNTVEKGYATLSIEPERGSGTNFTGFAEWSWSDTTLTYVNVRVDPHAPGHGWVQDKPDKTRKGGVGFGYWSYRGTYLYETVFDGGHLYTQTVWLTLLVGGAHTLREFATLDGKPFDGEIP